MVFDFYHKPLHPTIFLANTLIFGLVCQEIVVGDSDIVLAGGTENMSQAPFAVRDIRWGTKFGSDVKVNPH